MQKKEEIYSLLKLKKERILDVKNPLILNIYIYAEADCFSQLFHDNNLSKIKIGMGTYTNV